MIERWQQVVREIRDGMAIIVPQGYESVSDLPDSYLEQEPMVSLLRSVLDETTVFTFDVLQGRRLVLDGVDLCIEEIEPLEPFDELQNAWLAFVYEDGIDGWREERLSWIEADARYESVMDLVEGVWPEYVALVEGQVGEVDMSVRGPVRLIGHDLMVDVVSTILGVLCGAGPPSAPDLAVVTGAPKTKVPDLGELWRTASPAGRT